MTKATIVVCALMAMTLCDIVLYRKNPAMQALVKIVGWWPLILVEVAMACYIVLLFTIMLG